MLRRLSARQFREWIAYAELEPFGEERGDIRAALICSTLANINRDPKKKKEPFKIEDFLLKFGEQPKKKQDWRVTKAIAIALATAYAGKQTRRKKKLVS